MIFSTRLAIKNSGGADGGLYDRQLGRHLGFYQELETGNQRVPTANLWIINYCILEIKADDELAISLPVYFKSVKK